MSQNNQDLSKFEFVQVIEAGQVPQGERVTFEIDGLPIAVFNVGGDYYAVGDVCTHDEGPLADGELVGYQVICPRHGARFDVRTGKALTLPAVVDTPWYPTRVVEGWVEIGLPLE